jgi:replicative DNA helicase
MSNQFAKSIEKGQRDIENELALAQECVFDFDRFVALNVTSKHFLDPNARAAVEAAEAIAARSGRVGFESVAIELQRAGILAGMGGQEGFAKLLRSSAVGDAERLREQHRLREISYLGARIQLAAESGDIHGALAELSAGASAAYESSGAGAPVDARELMIELVEDLSSPRTAAALVHPGLDLMHEAIGMLPIGSLTVVGGGTNVGKSSLALAMLMGASARNVTCGYVSCEDGRPVVRSRIAAALDGVRISSKKLVNLDLTDQEKAEFFTAVGRVEGKLSRKFWINFAVGGNEVDVCAAISRQAALGCRLVVVDYVQAIESSKRQQDRRNEIRWLCSRIKAHAQRCNVALVLLSQLTRPPKDDEFREPTIHDLKEAGDLENAADYVVMMWREAVDDFAPVNVKIGKSKSGGNGNRWQMQRSVQSAASLREVPDSLMSPSGGRHR